MRATVVKWIVKRGKTETGVQGRENKYPLSSAGKWAEKGVGQEENIKRCRAQLATGAERGKIRNRCEARENVQPRKKYLSHYMTDVSLAEKKN